MQKQSIGLFEKGGRKGDGGGDGLRRIFQWGKKEMGVSERRRDYLCVKRSFRSEKRTGRGGKREKVRTAWWIRRMGKEFSAKRKEMENGGGKKFRDPRTGKGGTFN